MRENEKHKIHSISEFKFYKYFRKLDLEKWFIFCSNERNDEYTFSCYDFEHTGFGTCFVLKNHKYEKVCIDTRPAGSRVKSFSTRNEALLSLLIDMLQFINTMELKLGKQYINADKVKSFRERYGI